MATTGKINGGVLRVLVAGVGLACESGFTLTVEGQEIDVSCKEDGQWGDFLAGTKSWSLSINATLIYAALDNSYFDIVGNLIAGTELVIEVTPYVGGSTVVGDQYHSGTAIVLSTTLNGNNNEGATWSANFKGRGPLVTATRAL